MGYTLRCAAVAAFCLAAGGAAAQTDSSPVKIGLLSDQQSLYADAGGIGSYEAAKMAAEDAGLVLGKPVEVIAADFQVKPDVGLTIARKWFDVEGVDMITDVPHSAVALALLDMTREKKKIAIITAAAASDITGPKCSPYVFQWTFDSYSLGNTTAKAVLQNGGDSWYFLTADTAFGAALEGDTRKAITSNGGKVVGSVRHPVNTQDFASFLLQAQASKAKILALANAGGDLVNAVKQAGEFGLLAGGQMTIASIIPQIPDIDVIGLQAAQGMYATASFYWDLDENTRTFAKRFEERMKRAPGQVHAGTYSAVLHYLKAVKKAGTKDADKVAAAMRELPIEDLVTKRTEVRADGRAMRNMYLFQVKSPSESKGRWDYYKLVQELPAKDVMRPLSEGGCPHAIKG